MKSKIIEFLRRKSKILIGNVKKWTFEDSFTHIDCLKEKMVCFYRAEHGGFLEISIVQTNSNYWNTYKSRFAIHLNTPFQLKTRFAKNIEKASYFAKELMVSEIENITKWHSFIYKGESNYQINLNRFIIKKC